MSNGGKRGFEQTNENAEVEGEGASIESRSAPAPSRKRSKNEFERTLNIRPKPVHVQVKDGPHTNCRKVVERINKSILFPLNATLLPCLRYPANKATKSALGVFMETGNHKELLQIGSKILARSTVGIDTTIKIHCGDSRWIF
jgi:hypothetical protein